MRKYMEKIGQWISNESKTTTPMEFFFLKAAFIVAGFVGSMGHFLKWIAERGI